MRHPHGLRAAMANASPTDADFKQTVLLLHGDGTNGAQNNTFVGQNYQPDQYAVSFDGTGDYLSSTGGSGSAVGSGDFCVEAFVYQTSFPGSFNSVFSTRTGALNSTTGFSLGVHSTGYVYVYSNAFAAQTATSLFSLNQWNHIVATRSGTTVRLFINGVLRATGTNSQNFSDQPFSIGANGNGDEPMAGYISNIRLVKGSIPTDYQTSSTTVGTTIFTVPTAPLTAISGTSLLTCQSATIVDNSSNNFTITANGNAAAIATTTLYPAITRNGNTTQGTFTPFSAEAGKWSNYFDGTGDYLTAPAGSSFDFGTGDWSAECYFYLTGDAALNSDNSRDAGLFAISGSTTNAFNFSILGNSTTTGTGIQIFKATNTVTNINFSTTISKHTWHHVAVTRSSGSVRIFLNGTQIGTTTTSTTVWGSSTLTPTIGALQQTGYLHNFPGYISNLRIVKGTAVYTSNFTPPTTPLTAITNTSLLTCQDNRFRDASSNNFAITRNGDVRVTPFGPFAPSAAYSASVNGGSGYFDGTGDYLTAGSAADWKFLHDGSDWTAQFWLFHSGTGSQALFATTGATAQVGMSCGINDSAANEVNITFYRGVSGSFANFRSNAALRVNQWNYVAVTFTGSTKTCTFNINGVQEGSSTNTGFSYSSSNPSNTLHIGAALASGSIVVPLTGYLSSIRLSNTVRTGLTTIPTSPLSSDANTRLLCSFTNAGIIDSTGKNVLETVGNAQIDTTVKKYGTGAMEFDGNGDYLLIPDSPEWQFGSGDFTIECWVNFNVSTSGVGYAFVGQGNNAFTSNAGFIFARHSSNKLRFIYTDDGTGASGYKICDSANNFLPTTGVWYHLAVTRSGNTFRLFIDGVQDGSATLTTAIFNSTRRISVGADEDGALALNGFIDDLRITKGVARYTGNFTAPTAPFADK